MPSGEKIEERDIKRIRKVALEAAHGNASQTARLTGFHRTTVMKYAKGLLKSRNRRLANRQSGS